MMEKLKDNLNKLMRQQTGLNYDKTSKNSFERMNLSCKYTFNIRVKCRVKSARTSSQ